MPTYTDWRRFGWQQIELVAPAEWYLTKVSIERASGELWLSDAELPRVQLKWSDARSEKRVDPAGTLTAYLQSLQRTARKRHLPWLEERDIKLVGKGSRDVSSFEAFHWSSEIEAYGMIWYSPAAQRVTLAQVNGQAGEEGLKVLAKRVLSTIDDSPAGELDLWTAYNLQCRIPNSFALAEQHMETGRTELGFTRAKHGERLNVARYGLASVALEQVGELGDWAYQQRWKAWHNYLLTRVEEPLGSWPCVRFDGLKRSPVERARQKVFAFVGRRYAVALSAWAWHCPDQNALFVVEHLRDPRDEPLPPSLAALIPALPESVPIPKA